MLTFCAMRNANDLDFKLFLEQRSSRVFNASHECIKAACTKDMVQCLHAAPATSEQRSMLFLRMERC